MAAEKKPHVIVIITGDVPAKKNLEVHKAFEAGVLAGKKNNQARTWRGSAWDCVVSPGRAATLAAILYGRQALVSGVVNDYDWRRKPVPSLSLADHFHKKGMKTAFFGGWNLGDERGYYPGNRGFRSLGLIHVTERTGVQGMKVDESWNIGLPYPQDHYVTSSITSELKKEQAAFVIVNEWDQLLQAVNYYKLAEEVRKHLEKSDRSCQVVILRVNAGKQEAKRGQLPTEYHFPAKAYYYHYGERKAFSAGEKKLHKAKTDWELHHALLGLDGGDDAAEPDFRVFHKANWPVSESPDKFRHRGSLVVGKGHALVDGLQLYPATKEMLPDLTKPLDISEHQKLHAKMLAAHSKWWAKARPALHNPRPFLIGAEDKRPVKISGFGSDRTSVKLTSRDWRPSKIVRPDQSSPLSQPLVSQFQVTRLLRGLQDEKYRQAYPAHSGSWSVNILKPGRYQITAQLLPERIDQRHKELAKLRGGRAFVRLGKNLVQLQVAKGATSITVQTDADAGITDLECWFTGQLALERELGAFFVEIQRVGDKKFDLKAKPKDD